MRDCAGCLSKFRQNSAENPLPERVRPREPDPCAQSGGEEGIQPHLAVAGEGQPQGENGRSACAEGEICKQGQPKSGGEQAAQQALERLTQEKR